MITAPAAYLTELAKTNRTPIYQIKLNSGAPIPAPTAYWRLEEASGTRNDSVGTQHLTDNNTVTQATGKVGNAAQFTRANSEHLSIADNATLSTGDIDFTIAAWVYMDSKPVGQMDIVTKRNATGDNREYQLYWNDDTDRFQFEVYGASGASTVVVTASNIGSPQIGKWYHLIAWHDSVNNEICLQANNGAVNRTSTTGGTKNGTASFHIGSENGTTGFWDGRIDEVGFWKAVLTDAERKTLYARGNGVAYASLTDDPTIELCTSHTLTGEDLGERILEPLELDRKAEPDRGRFQLSELTFLLHDKEEAVTAIVATGIEGMSCEFYAGFRDIAWSGNNVQLFGGIITDWSKQGNAYRMTARSSMSSALEKAIFDGASTRLTSALTDSATTVNVVDTLAFDDAANSPDSARRHFYIDSEIFVYKAKTSTSFTLASRAAGVPWYVPPPAVGSEPDAHADDATVKEIVNLGELTGTNDETGGTNDMHPIADHFRNILTSGNVKKGMGSASIQINDTQIDAVATELGAELRFRFMGTQSVNGKRFLEEELLLAVAAYPLENNVGEISLKLLQGAADASFVGTVTDADIINFPRFLRNADRLVNTVIVHYDHQPIPDKFTSTYRYQDDALIGAHGREMPLKIDSKGIRSFFTTAGLEWFGDTAAFLEDMAQRHIARFGNKAPVIEVEAIFSKQLHEVGDDVEVSFDHVTDLAGATSMVEFPMEIIAMRHDFRTGLIRMELLAYPQ